MEAPPLFHRREMFLKFFSLIAVVVATMTMTATTTTTTQVIDANQGQSILFRYRTYTDGHVLYKAGEMNGYAYKIVDEFDKTFNSYGEDHLYAQHQETPERLADGSSVIVQHVNGTWLEGDVEAFDNELDTYRVKVTGCDGVRRVVHSKTLRLSPSNARFNESEDWKCDAGTKSLVFYRQHIGEGSCPTLRLGKFEAVQFVVRMTPSLTLRYEDLRVGDDKHVALDQKKNEYEIDDSVLYLNTFNKNWFSGKIINFRLVPGFYFYTIRADAPGHSRNSTIRLHSNIPASLIRPLNYTVASPCHTVSPTPTLTPPPGAIPAGAIAAIVIVVFIAVVGVASFVVFRFYRKSELKRKSRRTRMSVMARDGVVHRPDPRLVLDAGVPVWTPMATPQHPPTPPPARRKIPRQDNDDIYAEIRDNDNNYALVKYDDDSGKDDDDDAFSVAKTDSPGSGWPQEAYDVPDRSGSRYDIPGALEGSRNSINAMMAALAPTRPENWTPTSFADRKFASMANLDTYDMAPTPTRDAVRKSIDQLNYDVPSCNRPRRKPPGGVAEPEFATTPRSRRRRRSLQDVRPPPLPRPNPPPLPKANPPPLPDSNRKPRKLVRKESNLYAEIDFKRTDTPSGSIGAGIGQESAPGTPGVGRALSKYSQVMRELEEPVDSMNGNDGDDDDEFEEMRDQISPPTEMAPLVEKKGEKVGRSQTVNHGKSTGKPPIYARVRKSVS